MSRVKVSDVALINNKNFELKKVDFIHYLDTGSITNNVIEKYQYLSTSDKIPSRAKRAVSNGTIVYSSVRPRLCHFGYLENIPENTVVSTGFITIDAKPNINAYYLYNCLITQEKIDYIAQIADTAVSSYPSISPDDLGNMEIDIVDDYEEQCKIANALKVLQDKIDNNNRIVTELESIQNTIFDYWFLQYEFPDMNGKPYKLSGGKMTWDETLKKEIPEGWKIDSVGNHVEINRGISYSSEDLTGEGIPMINLNSFETDATYKIDGIKSYSGKYTDNKTVNPHELIICVTQQTAIDITGKTNVIGKAMLVPDIFDSDVVCSMDVMTLVSDDNYGKYYLRSLINVPFIHKYIVGFANGTKIKHLDINGLLELMHEIPDKTVLKKFNVLIEQIESRKDIIFKENQELISLHKMLLPMLLNGQVGFKGAKNAN